MSEIQVHIEDGVASIVLAAPERRNALTAQMASDLIDACRDIDATSSIGAVVVRGEGSAFCAGADRAVLSRVARDPAAEEVFNDIDSIYGSFVSVGNLAVPTIAAVRGPAVGAGLNLAMAADLRIVANDCQLISGFANLGVHPGGGHFHLLSGVAGQDAAAAIGLFGEPVSGAQAERLGMAWEALPPEQVEDRALQLARRAAADPQLARRMIRNFRMQVRRPGMPWSVAVQAEQATQMWSFRRRDLGPSSES